MKRLPPPTPEERTRAGEAAAAIRAVIADRTLLGPATTMHIDMSSPRRGVWLTSWASMPGLTREATAQGPIYTHRLLPGWQYTRSEVLRELIPDLEALATRGERPTMATGGATR